jgi:GNAT superfamily N-acetyltransferase
MIRQFRAEDATACSNVIHACVERDPQISAALRDRLLRSESPEEMLQRASLFYVAVYDSDEGILGVAGLDMNEIRLLYVVPEHQDEGIGGALLTHLESMIPPALFSDIFVYSTFAAVDFYRAHSYAADGEFTFDIDGEPLAAVFMKKAIR